MTTEGQLSMTLFINGGIMQGDVDKITKDYQERMQNLFASHEKQMRDAQIGFENAVKESARQMQDLIGQAESAPVNETPKPELLAVWSKTPSGEDCLILNREAAIMQMALLDQLSEVLQELSKLAPKRNG